MRFDQRVILTPFNAITSAPRGQQIHSGMAEQVSFTANAGNAGDYSKIFEFTAKIGQKIYIPNRTKVKGVIERGLAPVFSLVKADASEISGAAELHIAVQSPTHEAPEFVRRLSYQTFRQLETKDQRDDRFRARLAQACDLNTDGDAGLHQLLTIPEEWKLQVWLKGTADVIDPTKSYIEFPVFEETK
jgi:hypothetical protein